MTAKNPYKDSPYDFMGMPLGAETVDYDKQDDVAKATVKDKPVEFPESINDIDYTPRPLDKRVRPTEVDPLLFNSAIADDVNNPEDVDKINFEDPEEKQKLIVQEAEDKGIAVQELPKVEKQETVDEVKKDIENDKAENNQTVDANDDDTSFLDDKEEKSKK